MITLIGGRERDYFGRLRLGLGVWSEGATTGDDEVGVGGTNQPEPLAETE